MLSDNDFHVRAFTRDLRSRNLSPKTVDSYLDSIRTLRLDTQDAALDAITRDQLRGFFAGQLERYKPNSVAIRYRSLQQFFKWALAEDVRDDNPMLGMSPPTVPEVPVAVLTLEDVKLLLKVCGGKSFVDRRDTALFRLFLEPGGMRLSEMIGLRLTDLTEHDEAGVLGKGRRERGIPYGAKTGVALDRYLRERQKHEFAALPCLWLGVRGPLTNSGVAQMMRRRGSAAGIPGLHPHMLRHTAAHEWLAAGGSETDATRLFGWRTTAMLQRYGASVAADRAKTAARNLQLGDRY